MNWDERASILRSIAGVIDVAPVDDGDGTVCNGITAAQARYPGYHMTFCNGGDRAHSNTPERALCEALGINLAWDIGGGKEQSSTGLLSRWMTVPATVPRPWGEWSVLRDFGTSKVKELIVQPGQSLSMQRHRFRNEQWFIASGTGTLILDGKEISLLTDDSHYIPDNTWHQLINTGDVPLHVIEIQQGERCVEEDIERAIEGKVSAC